MTQKKLMSYVKETSQTYKQNQKEYFLYKNILVLVKDKLPSNFKLETALRTIEKTVPFELIKNVVDEVIVGQFSEFEERAINAFYENGAIYVTNLQKNEMDFAEDVVHEFAHAVEEKYGFDLYYDKELEKEFLSKRKKLYSMIFDQEPRGEVYKSFLNVDYDEEFDNFLYKTIGYQKLDNMVAGLFMSSYSITSIREYFANGFENYYFYNKGHLLQKVCPVLYSKILDLEEG